MATPRVSEKRIERIDRERTEIRNQIEGVRACIYAGEPVTAIERLNEVEGHVGELFDMIGHLLTKE